MSVIRAKISIETLHKNDFAIIVLYRNLIVEFKLTKTNWTTNNSNWFKRRYIQFKVLLDAEREQ